MIVREHQEERENSYFLSISRHQDSELKTYSLQTPGLA